jgi:FAD-dependent oxidoreductase family protein
MRSVPWIVNTVLAAALAGTIAWTVPAASSVPAVRSVDVLVVGGTPGGVAAAAAAARLGASVLLAEPSGELGGVLASAWLTTFDLNVDASGRHLTRGIFLEHFDALGTTFDRGDAARVMGRAIANEFGVRVALHAQPTRVLRDGDHITGIEFYDLRWRRQVIVSARQIVDATDDGDIAAAAGAPFVVGRPGERPGERWMQAATLIVRIGHVNWRAMVADIRARLLEGAEPFGWGIVGKSAWAYPDEAARFEPKDKRTLLYPLNLALQGDGSVLINAVNITGVDGLDARSIAEGRSVVVAELPGLVAHLRDSVPGFLGATILDYAPAMYIRETRHLSGLYTLTADDILANRFFDDRIAVASYPIDIHPYAPGWINPYPRMPLTYTIPYRSIVSTTPKNLLVASRAFSATSEAHGSARVVPTVMALGQAAGVAAALAVHNGWTLEEIANDPVRLRALHGSLIAQGAYLGGKP